MHNIYNRFSNMGTMPQLVFFKQSRRYQKREIISMECQIVFTMYPATFLISGSSHTEVKMPDVSRFFTVSWSPEYQFCF